MFRPSRRRMPGFPVRGRTGGEKAGGGFVVGDTTYRFIQVKPDRCFGGENLWVGEARVPMSDLERTLLDCLSMPQHCGGFGEALYAFQVAMPRLNIETHHRVRHQAGRYHSQALGVGARSPGSSPVGVGEAGCAADQWLPQA